MKSRWGLPSGFALVAVAILVGFIAGIDYGSLLPLSGQRDVAASSLTSISVGPEASGTEAVSGIVRTESGGAEIVKQGEAPTSSQETATYAAAPDPSALARISAPVIPAPAAAPLAMRLIPLPVPRPPEFRSSKASSPEPRVPARQSSRVAAAPPEDNRTFIEKLFGIENPEPPRLAYAALETKPVDTVFRKALNAVPSSGTGGVAIYDVRAKVVTLPNGEKLEAHSGFGERMDDPDHAHVRMKGPTPVGTYDISEREQPFHGIRALRLNPVGGPDAVHGRVGLLAHTYMLGANGASNGCVSFKDYDKFLQAYLRGDVQRLVVIAGG